MAESQREESKMASLQTDAWYLSLLGLAENFRTSNPPNIKLCIHCLQTIFTFKPSPRIEARTHLQLGSILYTHTKNSDLARLHLEQADIKCVVHRKYLSCIIFENPKSVAGQWALSQSIQSFEEVKFEAASLLGQLYEKQNRLGDAKPVIRKAVEISAQSPYWHCRLLFQLAQIHSIQRDYTAACSILGLGADYAGTKKAEYTKTLFLLTKGMWLMPYRDLNDCFTVLLFPISAESKFRLVVQYICMSMVLLHCTPLHSTPLPQEGKDIAILEGVQRSYLAFILTLLLIDKRLSDVHDVLGTAGRMVEDWTSPNHSQQESLKVFFLVLQVCHYLMAGQVKSVKPALKQLQQSIQTITSVHADDDPVQNSPPAVDNFQWLPKEHMCVLVYLVTVMHSMQAGYMDKAEKYTAKALMQIEKLKMLDSHPLLSSFQLMLLEHIIMCRLIMGNKTRAIQEISEVCHVCQQQPRLFSKHGAQIHTLLGLYAMSMNCMEAAEAQFKTALSKSSERELWTFVNLNLAIVYLRSNRQTDLLALLERIDPDAMTTCSHSLRASAFYVQGLQSFFQARYNEAKRYLRETLKMANAEDLNRLTSCSLVLLGHIFLSLGNSQEALNMVTPAMQLAGKIPDVHVQLWASALLKDVYRLCGNPQGEAEGFRLHDTFSQSLLKDHFQSSQQSEHKLIQWTEGPCPFEFGSSSSVTDGDLL